MDHATNHYAVRGQKEFHVVTLASPIEQEVKYRFYPHFHPFVSEMIDSLIEESISGLQAIDTKYDEHLGGRITAVLPESICGMLPDSTRIIIPDETKARISEGSQVTFSGHILTEFSKGSQVPLQDGTTIVLEDGTEIALLPGTQIRRKDGRKFQLSDRTLANLFRGSEVSLQNGIEGSLLDSTHGFLSDGTEVILPGKAIASFSRSTQVIRSDKTKISLHDGTKITLSRGTVVRRSDGTEIILSQNTDVILLGGKPKPMQFDGDYFKEYSPSNRVQHPYPVKDIDFSPSGAYSVYNWETFYHVPLTIAIHLSRNQRFEEAQRWFHYIFDPTDDSNGPTPERFWKVRPFQYTDVKLIEEILTNLSSGADPALQQETVDCIRMWRDSPFRPHVIARYRQTAYMFKTVMAYLDNLFSWGDVLFRQDTGESINEATQLYVLAANILGPRPQAVPKKGSMRPQTYANLRGELDAFQNSLKDLEAEIPFDLMPYPAKTSEIERLYTINSIGKTLYFCIPRNDKLLSYWDTAADRLFKIRNSLNIQGVFRQLPLFEPPIDPALLARAAAAGIDVGAVISGINQPLPLIRFQYLVQKAIEICQEVKSLGHDLLSAIEKEDNEALAVLRASHEHAILDLAEVTKYEQHQEAIKSIESLSISLENARQRFIYYERLLGRKGGDIRIPDIDALELDILEKMRSGAWKEEHVVRPRQIQIEFGTFKFGDDVYVPKDAEEKKLSLNELLELGYLATAQGFYDTAAVLDTIGSSVALIPQFRVHTAPMCIGTSFEFGGDELHNLFSALSSATKGVAGRLDYEAKRSAKMASYKRRSQEWAFQSNAAAGEINQIYKQLRAAQIREAIAERELKIHRQLILNAEEIERFLTEEKNGKLANKDFYTWMKREAKGLYSQCFQFAFDISKKAERALQQELGNPDLSFIKLGYLEGKEGLLAGEKLYMDIKRMEMAYHDLNHREYELAKHVSLLQVNPLALLQLRTTGRCVVYLPEEFFDLDCPGHYFRRIKSVALTIPCVAGPYVSVNCTLTLLKSSIRKTSQLMDVYARQDDDDRFSDYFGSLQSIVTSTGQSDSGMFETNIHDERFLPFEGSGVISEWQLELPNDFRQFDYDTISDVILHLRYTAREGGVRLKQQAIVELQNSLNEFIDLEGGKGLARLFNLRHEFPSEWHRFLNPPEELEGLQTLTMDLSKKRFPFLFQERPITISAMELFVKVKPEFADKYNNKQPYLTLEEGTEAPEIPDYFILSLTDWNDLLRATKDIDPAGQPGDWTLTAWLNGHERLNADAIEDIFLICSYLLE